VAVVIALALFIFVAVSIALAVSIAVAVFIAVAAFIAAAIFSLRLSFSLGLIEVTIAGLGAVSGPFGARILGREWVKIRSLEHARQAAERKNHREKEGVALHLWSLVAALEG
jgi:hypothetical protein